MAKKVVVGMSGGVDSSVAAYLLQQQGYEVIGLTMLLSPETEVSSLAAGDLHSDEETVVDGSFERHPDREYHTEMVGIKCPNGTSASKNSFNSYQTSGDCKKEDVSCGGSSAVEDARRVCDTIGVKHDVIDFRSKFRQEVINYFVSSYKRGNTPNPCIVCNQKIKWEALCEYADAHGADYIATGHYAKVVKLPNGRYTVACAAFSGKDQTYVLYRLTQEQLAHTLLPLGDYGKAQIRAIASQAELPVANKPDSQDICFIPDGDYAAFIEKITGEKEPEGAFVDLQGNIMGRHKGISHYTIGQRKGLGIAHSEPLFVKEIRSKTNEVVLCGGEELFSNRCIIEDVNYMALPGLEGEVEVMGKVRYSHRGAECLIIPLEGQKLECFFREPQRAITPGQAAVFYQNENVAFGGTIKF